MITNIVNQSKLKGFIVISMTFILIFSFVIPSSVYIQVSMAKMSSNDSPPSYEDCRRAVGKPPATPIGIEFLAVCLSFYPELKKTDGGSMDGDDRSPVIDGVTPFGQ
jgi:hypothetical protein